jgi:hypothetical protein
MMLMKYLVPFFFVLGLGLAGCDPESPQKPLANENPSKPGPAAAPDAIADRSVSLDRYSDLNAEPHGLALTYVLTAWDKQLEVLDDDQLLSRLSPTFHNEADAFKRRSLAETERPKVEKKLETYGAQQYFKLPVGGQLSDTFALNALSIGAYDFERRGFPIASYGASCWSASLRNPQGAYLKIEQGSVDCLLPVEDESEAQAIESARASGALKVRGDLYIFVRSVAVGTAHAIPVHARIELVDVRTETLLGTVVL